MIVKGKLTSMGNSITKSELKGLIREALNEALLEEDIYGDTYKGIDLHGLELEVWGPKIDAAFRKGWSRRAIQAAINDCAEY